MRIVVDTNVLVSSLLSPFGPPNAIRQLIAAGAVQICYDLRILHEYREVLTRPRFPFNAGDVDTLLAQIEADGILISTHPLTARLPDADDEPFLAVALVGHARCLVTGNLRDFPADRRQGVPVVSPRRFLELWRETEPSDAE